MHRLLQRQIKHYLGEAQTLTPELIVFAQAVSEAYESADADRAMIERSLELMSQELTERNADLRAQLVERQRAEAQLEQLLSLIGTTLESTTDGIMALDRDGRLVRFNQRFVEMWRIPDDVTAFWEHNQMMGCVCTQLKHPEDFLAKVDHLCGHPEEESSDLMECLDGRLVEHYSLPQPLGVDTVGRVFSFRDITERKLAEEALHCEKEEQRALIKKLETAHNQLLQSEKMASIGQLAAGVAHEINNPIGYVISNLSSLRHYVEQMLALIRMYEQAAGVIETQAPELVAAILEHQQAIDWAYLQGDILVLLDESAEGGRRVKQIVQDLKDFSHVDEVEWQVADLHKGLDSTLNIVRNEIKYKAKVVKEYGVLPAVQCIPSQINQVFMNLLVNAGHAIDEQGVITVRTKCEGAQVWVEVADTGSGIPPEVLGRIFDPFFTTKPVGKGTGLGLSISYGIIQKHGGRIEVDSEAGRGTTFRVWLPVQQDTAGDRPEQI